jgi:hypothetical protein
MNMHRKIETPVMDVAAGIDAATERMIELQIEAYPRGWTEAEYREVAVKHLFGAAAVPMMCRGAA